MTLKTISATDKPFTSAIGLQPIWSTQNTQGQIPTRGLGAENIVNENFSILEQVKADKGGSTKSLQQVEDLANLAIDNTRQIAIDGTINILFTRIGYMLNSAGQPTVSGWYAITEPIKVNKGTSIYYSGQNGASGNALVGYSDINLNNPVILLGSSGNYNNTNVITPNEVNYIIAGGLRPEFVPTPTPISLRIDSGLSGLKESTKLLTNRSQTPFVYLNYINASGVVTSSTDWTRTYFIDINAFMNAYVWGHSSVSNLAYYTDRDLSTNITASNMVLGAGWHFIDRSTMTIPANAKYVIISTSKNLSYFPNTYITLNTIAQMQSDISINTSDISTIKQSMSAINSTSKFMHMSFDDTINVFADLTAKASTYTSIFDNPFFKAIKGIHDRHGMVFSFYCWLESPTGFILSNTTTKFANEFKANSNWMKFGFHSRNTSTSYGNSITPETAKADYDSFITSIVAITGGIQSIDRAVRLHNFTGVLASMKAMRDTNIGIIGLLTADDSRDSYFLSVADYTYINAHDRIIDTVNHMRFFKSEKRLENAANISTYLSDFLTPSFANMSNDLVLFTHEQQIYPTVSGVVTTAMVDKIEACASWAYNNGYRFDYPMNVVLR
ncbi:hypothetical protein G7051_17670 [Dysgonomonas sp. HDW5B]|uniref:hypothetical protein n=1 Tax=Dysgonomonas sp. HDW5B TaxID=2714927 RepID=UPI00140827BB|nr:hypothetical protein [Dysgonomonas sp. HDW5B]QIK56090.1 hypothetical protein G7051_17670 [Dysgonomonas sp. HDW5B]